MEIIITIISASLISNVVLSRFLGICPFLGVSNKVETAKGMGLAVIFVIMIATVVTFSINHFFLEESGVFGIDLTYLQTIAFILIIACLVQFLEMFLKFPTAIAYAFGTSFGFCLSIVLLAGIREKIENNDIPESFKGKPIVLIIACLMAIAFTGFSNLNIG